LAIKILTVAPLFFPMPKNHLPDIVGDRTAVNYPNILPLNACAHTGAVNLNSAIISAYAGGANTVVVIGHSMGAQVIYKWFREFGPTSTIPKAAITFYCTGCPERKYGGASVLWPTKWPAAYPGDSKHYWWLGCPTPKQHHGGLGVGYGLPPDMPWTLYDITMQYDGWSDAYTNAGVVAAVSNARKGQLMPGPHIEYDKVVFAQCVTKVEGTVTYMWMPRANPVAKGVTKAQCEVGYSRPVVLPA
jgi:hypothetical protein